MSWSSDETDLSLGITLGISDVPRRQDSQLNPLQLSLWAQVYLGVTLILVSIHVEFRHSR